MSFEKNALLHINVNNIEDNPNALRKVDPENVDYESLVDSIKNVGVLSAISVIVAYDAKGDPKTDEQGNAIYRLVDGLHRLTAARDAGLTTIPAQVLKATEAQAMANQLIANAHTIETKPWQYSQHLVRILMRDQTMTISELADKLSMNADWLNKRLGLVNLSPEIGKMVDEEKITVSNAVELAKLQPVSEQQAFVEKAMSEPPQTFVPAVQARIKQLRAAKREGRRPGAPEFEARAHLRKPSEVKTAIESGEVAQRVKAAGISDPGEAAIFGLKWVLHLDEASVSDARAKFEAEQAKQQAERDRKKVEKDKQRAEAARLKLQVSGVSVEDSSDDE